MWRITEDQLKDEYPIVFKYVTSLYNYEINTIDKFKTIISKIPEHVVDYLAFEYIDDEMVENPKDISKYTNKAYEMKNFLIKTGISDVKYFLGENEIMIFFGWMIMVRHNIYKTTKFINAMNKQGYFKKVAELAKRIGVIELNVEEGGVNKTVKINIGEIKTMRFFNVFGKAPAEFITFFSGDVEVLEDLVNPTKEEFALLVNGLMDIDRSKPIWNQTESYIVYTLYQIVKYMTVNNTWEWDSEIAEKSQERKTEMRKKEELDLASELEKEKMFKNAINAFEEAWKKYILYLKEEGKYEEKQKIYEEVEKKYSEGIFGRIKEKILVTKLKMTFEPLRALIKNHGPVKKASGLIFHLLKVTYGDDMRDVFEKYNVDQFHSLLTDIQSTTFLDDINSDAKKLLNNRNTPLYLISKHIFNFYFKKNPTLQKYGIHGATIYTAYMHYRFNKSSSQYKISSLISIGKNINAKKDNKVTMTTTNPKLNTTPSFNFVDQKMLNLVQSQIGALIAEQKRKIMNKLDTRFARGVNITDEIIVKFYEMDQLVRESIHSIILMPNFKYDGSTNMISGFVLLFRDDVHMFPEFIKILPTIGTCTASYKSTSKNLFHPDEKYEKLLVDLLIGNIKRDNGPVLGPTLTDKVSIDNETWDIIINKKDKNEWVQKLEGGDHVTTAFSYKDKMIEMIIRSSAMQSHNDLVNIISNYCDARFKSDEIPMLKDLVANDGNLRGVYDMHLVNSLRNNERAAWESARFFRTRLMHHFDTMSSFGTKNTLAKNATSRYVQYSNHFKHHQGLDPKDYYYHVLKSREGVVSMYEGKGNYQGGCIAYYNGCSDLKYFRKEYIQNRLQRKKVTPKSWKMMLSVDDIGSIGVVTIPCNLNKSSFMAFPEELSYKNKTALMKSNKKKDNKKLMEMGIGSNVVEKKVEKLNKDVEKADPETFFSKIDEQIKPPQIYANQKKLHEMKVKVIESKMSEKTDPVLTCKVIEVKGNSIKSGIKKYRFYKNKDLNETIEDALCSTQLSDIQMFYPHTKIVIKL